MQRTTYKLELAYDGTRYAGFAKQKEQLTIEGELLKALRPYIDGLPAMVCGGRTDKGVHATGQVVSFWSHTDYSVETLSDFLTELPPDIVIQNICVVPRSFHARYSAKGRRYVYFAPMVSASAHRMNAMLSDLLGRRCFSAFARNTPAGKSTVRNLWDARVRVVGHGQHAVLRFDFGADGFLRKQIRVLVATTLQAAQDSQDDNYLRRLCDSGDRRLTARPASPHGLYLSRIIYPPV